MKRWYGLSLVLLLSTASFSQTFSITGYGAVADGTTNNAAAIQKAIDTCNKNGGGTVYVPAGTFVTGTFHLKSNVNLYLENGAVLKGSPHLSDYDTYTIVGYGLNYYGMLYTAGAENVSITGQGKIDGNNFVYLDFSKAKKIDSAGTQFTRQKENYRHVVAGIGDGPVVPNNMRPHQMLIFSNCKNVRLHGISLLNSPFWTLHFADCDGVNVDGISIASGMLVPNADGIDVTSCSNVVVANCDIRAGDDAIAIVGYDHHFEIPGFSEIKHISQNILISNCNLQSYSSGIRIGFLDQNSVSNVQVNNVNITNSTRGIGIFVRDEGSLQHIHFSNMYIETKLRTGDWWGNGEPIHLSAVRGKKDVRLGRIEDVTFSHISCKSENGILIWGSPESIMEGLTLDHITLQLENSPLNSVAGGNIDLRGCLDPKEQLFAADIAAFKIRYVDGLSMEHCKVNWDSAMTQPYFTNAVEVGHCTNIKLEDFSGTHAPSAPKGPATLFTNVTFRP
jgi:polygalacturonase